MNPPPIIYPAIVFGLFIIVGGLVILLQPISKRLGSYLEVLIEQRRRELGAQPMPREDLAQITAMLETIDQRLVRLEDRQDFAEKLLAEKSQRTDHPVQR